DDQADCVVLEYFDQGSWSQALVQYPPNSDTFTAQQPATIRIDGIVDRDQAFREAAFYYLQSAYRRATVTCDTEHDGRMLSFGSAVQVQTELPTSWGAAGRIAGVTSGTHLALDPAP